MKSLMMISLCLLVAGCAEHSNSNDHENPQQPGGQTEQPGGQNGQTEQPGGESLKKVALHRDITGVQPGTGIVFWPDQAKSLNADYGDAIRLEFSYCLPSDVVTGKKDGKIQYNWQSFDALLDDIASRNHQAVIRFRYEYPSGDALDGEVGATAVPAYITQRKQPAECKHLRSVFSGWCGC